MKNFKRIAIFLIAIMITTSLIGCSKKEHVTNNDTTSKSTVQKDDTTHNTADNIENTVDSTDTKNDSEKLSDFIISETDQSIIYKNPLGEEVTITKNPKKVVVLMNSILDIWYLAGGEAIARVSGTTNVPEAAKDIEQVGKVNGPSIEKIIALEPDLVILSSTRSQHVDMQEILKSNNIECAYVDISNNPYKRFNDTLKLFTMITGREDIYNTTVKQLQTEVNAICEKVKNEEHPKVVLLFGSSKYVKAELPCGLVGNMAQMLGATNIIQGSPVKGSSKVTLSLEKIIQEDPDIVLIVTMGDVEKAKARIKEDLENNEAWESLSAVQNGKVHYLPSDLFHYKPNARYPEAFTHLAKIIYPQAFNK